MKREDFLEAYYRIWGVDEDPANRLALLDRVRSPVGGSDVSGFSAKAQLHLREEFEFPSMEDREDNDFQEEREIHISKYCWEKGIDSTDSGQLRYFETHHPVVRTLAPEDKTARLKWFQNQFIFSA
jgi:hypothetical protein